MSTLPYPTKRQWAELARYVRWIANELGLRDWTVDLSYDEPENPEHIAENETVYGRKRLTLRFSTAFWNTSAERQRETVIHELLHAHFEDMQQPLWALDELIGALAKPIQDWHLHALERCVDAIAEEIAKHYPEPKPALRGENAA